MSSNKTPKSSSLSKLFSRISRTLLFTSKKSQQPFKNNHKQVKPTETIIKNVNFVPQSAPVFRRHPSHLISKVIYTENYHHQQIHVESNIKEEDDDDDDFRYSLRANLSLFNISTDNLHYPSLQHEWLDEIFHSTKIEDH